MILEEQVITKHGGQKDSLKKVSFKKHRQNEISNSAEAQKMHSAGTESFKSKLRSVPTAS